MYVLSQSPQILNQSWRKVEPLSYLLMEMNHREADDKDKSKGLELTLKGHFSVTSP